MTLGAVTCCAPKQAVRQDTDTPQIIISMQELDVATAALNEALDVLEQKIFGILKPEGPTCTESVEAEKYCSDLAPLAANITSIRDRIRYSTGRVGVLTARAQI